MLMIPALIIIFGFLTVQASSDYYSRSRCLQVLDFNGTIEREINYANFWNPAKQDLQSECWKISVQEGKILRLKLQNVWFNSENCDYNYLKISSRKDFEDHKFCRNNDFSLPITITFFNDVEINFWIRANPPGRFSLEYEIQDIQCYREDSFECTSHSCIPKSQVCDEKEDCPNGADEIGCATGVNSVEGVDDARRKAMAKLRKMRIPLKGWNENTVRTIMTFYLSEKLKFNEKIFEEELMAKQIELETAVLLLKTSVTTQMLSTHINALLLTCQNPRSFYGRDLVKLLRDQIKTSGSFTHPLGYLTLCNANEEWPERATGDLMKILSSDSEYTFIKDFQAFAVMAVACYNQSTFFNETENTDLLSQYLKIIKNFKESQLPDGSFGNVHATALITQSLMSSGQEHSKDWKLNATIKYLIKELNSTQMDFLTYYLTLPILNRKSLSDVAKVNCSMNFSDKLETNVNYNRGSKIQIQYSLYVGDNKEIIHTIYLKVPETFTAFEVMQFAEAKDSKYKFLWKRVSNKIDVYNIAQIGNDPEVGKFWQIFHGTKSSDVLTLFTESPDQLTLKDTNHLVLWYKYVDV